MASVSANAPAPPCTVFEINDTGFTAKSADSAAKNKRPQGYGIRTVTLKRLLPKML